MSGQNDKTTAATEQRRVGLCVTRSEPDDDGIVEIGVIITTRTHSEEIAKTSACDVEFFDDDNISIEIEDCVGNITIS